MSRRDLRPVIFANALAHPDLGNAERLFLVVVVHLPTEYVDGERRPGSQGMTASGNFSLHYDYLARALHTTPGNAKKLTQRLEASGALSKRWPGTYGRPAGYQALDLTEAVRGDTTSMITTRAPFVPPYGDADPTTRGDMVSPLTYGTPADGEHLATSGVSPQARNKVEAARREQAELPVRFSLTGCIWHEHSCPDDCAKQPASREATA